MKKKILAIINNVTSGVLLPFLVYYLFTTVSELDTLNLAGKLVFYILVLLYVCFFTLYQCERIQDFISKKIGQMKFICSIIYIVMNFSAIFASFYTCLFIDNSSNFKNVIIGNRAEIYIDFFFYSLGLFVMNNPSSIEAVTIYSKLFVGAQLITIFVMLIIILTNYRELNNPFNEYLKNKK